MSEAELAAGDAAAPDGASIRIPWAAQFFREGWTYLVVSVLALAIDYGLLVLLTEVGHLHYLLSSTISYCIGAVAHYVMSTRWVFRSRPVADRRVEFVGFFAIGLLGLGATQAILWLSVAVAHLSYLVGKVGATAVSFALNFAVRKALLFSAGKRQAA